MVQNASQPQQLHTTHELVENPVWYKALTLTERLALLRDQSSSRHAASSFDSNLAARKFQSWKEQSPFDRGTYFAERLAVNNMTEDELLLILGEASESIKARSRVTPDWLQEIAEAFTTPDPSDVFPGYDHDTNDEQTELLHPRYNMSFLPSVYPLIVRGVERLKAGVETLTATYAVLPFDPDTVHLILLANLPGQILPQLTRTLTLELNVARLEERLHGHTPEERFQNFLQQINRKETMLSILEEYVPLARMLVVTIDNWVNYGLEFLRHLCTDWNDIRQEIMCECDLGRLVEVNGGVGDLHKSGRSTLKLKFDSGFQLIYKPKSMTIDVHFQELLLWLNERGDHPAFRLLKIVDRRTYGWSEFVTAHSCCSEEEVARFYERQGGYLALFYALEATDVHFENLIAAGEHPVMVDLESLFHPRTELYTPLSSETIVMETLSYSVLRIGLLPQRIWGDMEHEGIDTSGLGGKGGQTTPRPVLQVEAVGTDQMRFVRQHVELPDRQNRPQLADKNVDVLDYADQLLSGFSKIYRLLITYREELLAGPILQFAHDEIRLIVRPTQTYAQLLQESYHPDLLRDALDRDRFFDRLWMGTEHRSDLKRVIAAEQADLRTENIPMFTSRPDAWDIYTSRGERIPDFLHEPSLEAVRKRLHLFDERDMKKQTWFIQASLAAILIANGHAGHKRSILVPSQSEATRDRLLKAACAIGDRLCEQALVSEHGANWIGLSYVNEREWSLLPARADLYGGTPGIALFLAYLGAVTEEEKYTTFAKAALATVREQVKELRKQAIGLGGYDGWGSILYLYAHLGSLWREQTLLDEAMNILKLIPDLIETDQALDMIAGSAGGILCLLSLYFVTPSPDILTLAIQCGDWLIAKAAQCNGDLQSPTEQNKTPTSLNRPLTGLSHGATGISLSLLKLAAASGEERFQKAAIAAMEYERSTFSSEKQNWPDFRDLEKADTTRSSQLEGETIYMVTWCHGAPGIGLGRLASLQYIDDAAIREEISIALKTTRLQGFGLNHSLCHGDLGNLEVLLTASQVLDDPQYHEHVKHFAAMILDSIDTQGWCTGIPMGVESPGLMTGIAGIGYELLRLAMAEKVPSVLLLAPPHTNHV